MFSTSAVSFLMGTGMNYEKPHRFRSKENLEHVRGLPCIVCQSGPCDPHHVRSRASGGGDEISNLVPLCRNHHTQIHSIGRTSFQKKYGLNLQPEGEE